MCNLHVYKLGENKKKKNHLHKIVQFENKRKPNCTLQQDNQTLGLTGLKSAMVGIRSVP